MPLVSDLTSELREELQPRAMRRSNWQARANGVGHPACVIDDMIAVMHKPGMHYENWLGYLETRYREPGAHRQDYHGMYQWLTAAVGNVLYVRHFKNVIVLMETLRYLDGIVGLARQNAPLWIFTLNHDLIVELLCAKFDVPVSCGFTARSTLPLRDVQGQVIGELAVETLTEPELTNQELQFFGRGSSGVNMLKVHGAIDVFAYKDGLDLLRVVTKPKDAFEVLTAVGNAHTNLRVVQGFTLRSDRPTNEIAFEDASGNLQFLRRSILAGSFKFDERSAQTLPKVFLPLFRRYLLEVNELMSIGYGFGDRHINDALRAWLEQDAARQLLIVDPARSTPPPDMLHVPDQLVILRSTATDFLEQFSPQPLSDGEREIRSRLRDARLRLRENRGYA
jgi:hypothetical protein